MLAPSVSPSYKGKAAKIYGAGAGAGAGANGGGKEGSSVKSRKRKRPDAEDAKRQGGKATRNEHVVSKVLAHRTRQGRLEFQVRWKGYTAADDTWEPEAHMVGNAAHRKYSERFFLRKGYVP